MLITGTGPVHLAMDNFMPPVVKNKPMKPIIHLPPDYHPDYPARMYLMKVYFAQADFKGRHGRWASSVEELGLAGNSVPEKARIDANKRLEDMGLAPKDNAPFAASARIEVTEPGYKASVDSTRGGRWYVREDSRLWHDAK